DAALQCVAVPFGTAQFGNPRGDVVGAEMSYAQVLPQPRDEACMEVRSLLTEVGQLAHLPQPAHLVRRLDVTRDRRVVGEAPQHGEVDRLWRRHERLG